MGQDHLPSATAPDNERRLKIALALTGTYLVAEVAGGIITGSLALLSDAAHMLTDVMALVLALVAIAIGKRPADRRRTFGYRRFEILAAAVNAAVLFLVAFYILFEAYQRFRVPSEIESTGMLVVASIGLVVNLVSMRLLRQGSEDNLNMKGAYLEVWSDLLGSIAVIIAAGIIWLTGWKQVDPILAVLIGFWVLPRTWTLLRESTNVLLEGVPEGIEIQSIYDALAALPGVRAVHDLHVWAITSGSNSMTVHLVADDAVTSRADLVQAAQLLALENGIEHTSVQVEDAAIAASEKSVHPGPAGPDVSTFNKKAT